MKKSEIDEQKLTAFVLMPYGLDTAFKKWWSSLSDDHNVQVRYPYERHGLSGHSSNTVEPLITDTPNSGHLRLMDI